MLVCNDFSQKRSCLLLTDVKWICSIMKKIKFTVKVWVVFSVLSILNPYLGIDKLTGKSPFWVSFVFAHKNQLIDFHSYLFFNRVGKIKKSLIY